MKERIQKLIAESGECSRRKAEELIIEGKVKVNGKTAKIGETASREDKITIEGRTIKQERKLLVMLNKPKGIISTSEDEQGRKTVIDLVKIKERLYPVGRLDKDAEGLMLLTNDGSFANKITHPRYEIKKTYEVDLDKEIKEEDLDKINKGVIVEKRKVKAETKKIKTRKAEIKIHEGRKHIVKKIFEELGYKVNNLKRTKIGNLSLGNLEKGKWRTISQTEIFLEIKKPRPAR